MFISELVTMEICSKGAPEIKYSILTGRIRWREPGGRSQAPMNHEWFFPMIWDLDFFLSWNDLALIFFWILVDAFEWFIFPMICSSRCVFQVAPHHPPGRSRVEKALKKTHTQSSANCQQLLVHCGWNKVTHEKIMKIAGKNEACRMLISPQPTPMCRHNLTSSTPGRREIPSGNKHISLPYEKNTKPVSNIWSLLWISIQHADLGFSKLRNTWHFSALLYLHGSCIARLPETWLATHGALLSPWDLLQPSDLHACLAVFGCISNRSSKF